MGAIESSDLQFHTNIDTGIEIKLDKKLHSYVPGETVSGTLSINQPRHQNETLSIDLIGELGYTMNYSTDINTTRITYHRYPFFTVSKVSIRDGEKFDLRLDEKLPPSVNAEAETYPYVRYVLQVNLSRAKKHRHWVVVSPRIATPPSNIQPVYFDAFNRKQIRLVGSLDLEWVLPGDRFKVEFKITNPNHEYIKHVDGNITMRAKLKGIEYTEKVMDFVIEDVQDTTDDQITGMVPLTVPVRYFPPTFSYKNDMNTFFVNVEYWITITVHVQGVNTSMKANIPIMLGYEPENITFNEVSPLDRPRLSTTSLHTKRSFRKHRLHRFSHV
jgi:hypothetical protein